MLWGSLLLHNDAWHIFGNSQAYTTLWPQLYVSRSNHNDSASIWLPCHMLLSLSLQWHEGGIKQQDSSSLLANSLAMTIFQKVVWWMFSIPGRKPGRPIVLRPPSVSPTELVLDEIYHFVMGLMSEPSSLRGATSSDQENVYMIKVCAYSVRLRGSFLVRQGDPFWDHQVLLIITSKLCY